MRLIQVVSVHSFRGGTGKSNLTANLAVQLGQHDMRVGVVDTDLASPGIHVLFGLDGSDVGRSLNDYLFGRCAISEVSRPVGPADLGGSIHLIPASVQAGEISQVLHEGRVAASENITVRSQTSVTAVGGNGRLERVTLEGRDGAVEESVRGMFVFIGASPKTGWLDGTVVTDEQGFVVTGPRLRPDRWALERDPFLLETSLPGVFAVGDVRSTSVKRVASAVGEGSVAVQFVHQVLDGA